MKIEYIELKELYQFLGENDCNPNVTAYLPYNDYPTIKRENRPSIIICPGGGYGMCCDREGEPYAIRFAALGFNAFVLKYSVAPNHFPTQLREVAATMELIYKNAEEWCCDTSKIAIIGFSAGAHLAGHYSVDFDLPEVRECFPESKSVNATILSYPVISADEKEGHIPSFQNLLGHVPTDEEREKFSLENRVRECTPPAFIWHTVTDQIVPVENSLRYAYALSKYKIPYELHIYPYGPHGLSTVDRVTNGDLPKEMTLSRDWIEKANDWLDIIFDMHR